MRTLLSLFAVILFGAGVRAGDSAADNHSKVIAPYVNDQTFLVAHVDVSRIDFDVVSKYLDAGNVEKVKAVASLAKATFLRSGGKDLYVLMNWANPTGEVLLVAPLGKDAA